MKITSFNPNILTPNADDVIAVFEALGFQRAHNTVGINDSDISSVRMKDDNGFHVDITKIEKLPQDRTIIRMNVDNFDEAFEFLTARGFKNGQGDKVTVSSSSKATTMVAPSGFTISLIEHLKK